MKIRDIVDQCGTMTVRTAPLLMLIGAVLQKDQGPELTTLIEMLDPESDMDE